MTKHFNQSLVLASSSPRRRQLLQEAGYRFEVAPPTIAEPFAAVTLTVPAIAWAEAMAWFKASAVARSRTEGIIIGADTIVTHNGTLLGKPRDINDARRMLSSMFAGTNYVITGLAILSLKDNQRIITHDISILDMHAMSPRQLEEYLASGNWQGKAGAYALQEGGDKFVKSIRGSESNIVGLPVEKLDVLLSRFAS